jgi:cell division septum initiation protein DivIVA
MPDLVLLARGLAGILEVASGLYVGYRRREAERLMDIFARDWQRVLERYEELSERCEESERQLAEAKTQIENGHRENKALTKAAG